MNEVKKKLLLLEDDPHLISVYSYQLTGDGFNVLTADDEDEGLELALKEKPDIIILDISLPKNEDFGFIKEVKNNSEIANTPIVILTDLYSEEDIKNGLAYGACDYLVRDRISFSEVIEKIKKILEK